MKFYQIKNPTTAQIFEAIINNEYTPLKMIRPKAKQIEPLLKDHFNSEEIFISFLNVTNTGGYPVFFSSECCMYEVLEDVNPDFKKYLTDDEKEREVEIFASYIITFNDIF